MTKIIDSKWRLEAELKKRHTMKRNATLYSNDPNNVLQLEKSIKTIEQRLLELEMIEVLTK